jgi:hypothetical protein
MTQPFTAVAIGETIFMILPLRLSVDRVVYFFYKSMFLLTKRGLLGAASRTSGIAFSFLSKLSKHRSIRDN